VITTTGIGDQLRLEWPITITGTRTHICHAWRQPDFGQRAAFEIDIEPDGRKRAPAITLLD